MDSLVQIQSCVRMKQARESFLKEKSVVFLQSMVRKKHAREQYLEKQNALSQHASDFVEVQASHFKISYKPNVAVI